MIRKLLNFSLIVGILLGSVETEIFAGESSNSQRSITFPTDPFSFQPGQGREIANSYCVICHSADYIYMQPPHSQGKWTAIIKKMKHAFGCPIPDDSIVTLASYLTHQNEVQPTALNPANVQALSSTADTANVNTNNGKVIYTANCINCHGTKGFGDGPIGHMLIPPAADLTLLEKKSDQELLATIRKGRPGTAMPPWKGSLSAQDITDVLSYVRSLSRE